MYKELAIEKIRSHMEYIPYVVGEWGAVRNGDYYVQKLMSSFKEILSLSSSQLDFWSDGDDYYIGQFRNGRPHGLGLIYRQYPINNEDGYNEWTVFAGWWTNGSKSSGTYCSYKGGESRWFYQYVRYDSSTGEGKYDFQISHRGIIS